MATINGTAGDDVFSNAASSDVYFGGAGNDTLTFGFGSGSDVFNGGNGTDMLLLTVSIFNVAYVEDAFIDYAPFIQDFDLSRRVVLSDGSTVNNQISKDIGWEQFQAADTNVLTHFFSGSGGTVTGTAANEIFGGSASGQTMSGGDGNDVL